MEISQEQKKEFKENCRYINNKELNTYLNYLVKLERREVENSLSFYKTYLEDLYSMLKRLDYQNIETEDLLKICELRDKIYILQELLKTKE